MSLPPKSLARRGVVPWLALGVLALGCRSPFGEIDRNNAHEHLDQAEADLQSGEYERALEHLSKIHDIDGLDPDLRSREQALIDEAARRRFEELESASSDELEDLFSSELPARVRARAGILAAKRLLEEGSRISAYRMVKKVDQALPGHPERVLAGEVVAQAGLSLIQDERRYKLFFHYRPRGVQALEYLVVNYPLERRCPEAYYALSESYEEDEDLDQAIARIEDLLLYHPDSPYSSGASARLPYLRLCRLRRDDYDRGEFLRAHSELSAWIGKYPDHELLSWVEDLQKDCRTRLVRNDLILARFYRRTGSQAGQRMHAQRALTLAVEAGLTAEEQTARAILERLPAETPLEPPPTAAAPISRQ